MADFTRALMWPRDEKLRRVVETFTRLLVTLGATKFDQDTLIGIAAVESAFDINASGGLGERGLWQIEKDELPLNTQTENALKQIRNFEGGFAGLGGPPFDNLVDLSREMKMRLLRANWQRGQRAPGALSRWATDIRNRLEVARLTAGSGPGVSVDMARILARDTVAGGKGELLGVNDFIEFSRKEGSDADALRRGQEAFNQFMRTFKWAPTSFLKGDSVLGDIAGGLGVPGGAFGDSGGGPSGGLSGMIRWGFEQLREGGKEFAGQTLKTFIPLGTLLGAGILGYHAVKAFSARAGKWFGGSA